MVLLDTAQWRLSDRLSRRPSGPNSNIYSYALIFASGRVTGVYLTDKGLWLQVMS